MGPNPDLGPNPGPGGPLCVWGGGGVFQRGRDQHLCCMNDLGKRESGCHQCTLAILLCVYLQREDSNTCRLRSWNCYRGGLLSRSDRLILSSARPHSPNRCDASNRESQTRVAALQLTLIGHNLDGAPGVCRRV